MKVKQYYVVIYKALHIFGSEVNRLLNEDWELHGSTFYGCSGYCQAIVMRGEIKRPGDNIPDYHDKV